MTHRAWIRDLIKGVWNTAVAARSERSIPGFLARPNCDAMFIVYHNIIVLEGFRDGRLWCVQSAVEHAD